MDSPNQLLSIPLSHSYLSSYVRIRGICLFFCLRFFLMQWFELMLMFYINLYINVPIFHIIFNIIWIYEWDYVIRAEVWLTQADNKSWNTTSFVLADVYRISMIFCIVVHFHETINFFVNTQWPKSCHQKYKSPKNHEWNMLYTQSQP